jgi:hypothetical protein
MVFSKAAFYHDYGYLRNVCLKMNWSYVVKVFFHTHRFEVTLTMQGDQSLIFFGCNVLRKLSVQEVTLGGSGQKSIGRETNGLAYELQQVSRALG